MNYIKKLSRFYNLPLPKSLKWPAATTNVNIVNCTTFIANCTVQTNSNSKDTSNGHSHITKKQFNTL